MAVCGGGSFVLNRIKKGPWQVEDTCRKYENAWLTVLEDRVITPLGEPGAYTTVKFKPGVSVLAIGERNEVYLTAEYRYAIEQNSIEVVSGATEDGETPETAARRELREELGIDAEHLLDVGTVHPLTSNLLAPARLFLAKGLSFFEPKTEDCEIIELVTMSLSEAVEMVMASKITHAPSCVLILKANQLLSLK